MQPGRRRGYLVEPFPPKLLVDDQVGHEAALECPQHLWKALRESRNIVLDALSVPEALRLIGDDIDLIYVVVRLNALTRFKLGRTPGCQSDLWGQA